MAFRATYQLEGARPNHGYIAGVHFFEPKGTKLADITAFGGRRLPGGHDVLTRDGVTATVIAAWDFGTLHADAKGNARAEFSYSIPARDYHLQFTVRRGECRPDQGKTSGCAAVFRSGSRFGQNLTVISPSSTGKQSKAAHPSVAGEWIVEGGYCTGSPMQVVQAASGEVKSISSDITCRNGETGGWDGRNIRWTGPSTLTFDYAIRPGSAPNLKGGAVRIEYKSDGSATQHWHASTGQSGSENLRRGKPADASLGSHPRVDGVWVQQGGYCDGARQTVSQDPSGKVTSIVTPFKCRNGETGTWDASNIRWESRNVLRYDYSFRPGGPANFEPGHHRLEFVDAANAKLAFKTANHSGNEKLIRKAGVDGNRVVD